MRNDSRSETPAPAVGALVEPTVRPRAWMRRWYFDGETHRLSCGNSVAYGADEFAAVRQQYEALGDDPAWPEASPSSGMGSRAEQQAATSVEQDAADAAHQRSQAEASPYQEGGST